MRVWTSVWNKWVGKEHLSRRGRVGHWHGAVGWGSRGGQCRMRSPVGLGLAKCSGVWMPMWISSLGFQLATWKQLDMQPRAGIVGILLGVGVWYQRSERKPREGVWGTCCLRHCPGASIPTGLHVIDQPCSLALALLFLMFLLISDLILDLAHCKGTPEFSWYK